MDRAMGPAVRGRGGMGGMGGRLRHPRIVRNDLVPVPIYAHQVRPNRQPGDRADFAETLFWRSGTNS